MYPFRDHSLATGSREYSGEVVLSRANPPGSWAMGRGPGREIWATPWHQLCVLDFSLPAHAHLFLGQAHSRVTRQQRGLGGKVSSLTSDGKEWPAAGDRPTLGKNQGKIGVAQEECQVPS